MKFSINGKKYKFEIFTENRGSEVCFYIRTICKSTNRTSCINNLNTILSELNVSPESPKYGDSMWVVKKNEAKKYVKIVKGFLSSYTFLTYLERRLDDDRRESEWENLYN